MINLVQQMNAEQVGALLIYGANPAYDYVDVDAIQKRIKKSWIDCFIQRKNG
jgi:molybdopterin-containing oxidoreductase family iron-sulfur binding subunit